MLSINISELIWTIINFFLLYFLLKRFLYDPISRFMDARRERLDEALEKEREAQARVAENDEQIEQEKELRRAEAKKLIAEGAHLTVRPWPRRRNALRRSLNGKKPNWTPGRRSLLPPWHSSFCTGSRTHDP